MNPSEPPVNDLIHEKSPYLRQHARNPVHWYPWGEEAFAKARREAKPIFLSIGYSTCHWCHVMAHESFENAEIARILNESFISIKVDREERPDVDSVYMTYVQATTHSGGWPLSAWLTPDLKPFLGGTYFPPDDRWARPGLKTVLLRVAEAWQQDRATLIAASETVLQRLHQATAAAGQTPLGGIDNALLDRTYDVFKAEFDPRYGGFGGAPKFPRPSVPTFLLRYYAKTGKREALDMVLLTLRKMADGGLHDPLGGGFHRYSVDERWQVPHFEKMLYDQGQLATTYIDAYQVTHDPFFAEIARGILEYVRRDLMGEQGQFYSAEDADSPIPGGSGTSRASAEGAFYVWTQREITDLLEPATAELFRSYYGVEERGNVRNDLQGEWTGRNILFVARTVDETARQFNRTAREVQNTLAEARQCLFAARAKRPRPHLDDKAITAWNGLMISAFARAYQVLGDEQDLASAQVAAAFIRRHLYDEKSGTLRRRYCQGEAAIAGYAADYAFLIQGLLDLYETDFDVEHLIWALALQKQQDALFWDSRNGGYFSTTDKDKTILLRLKEDTDGAEPSPNSIALLNLLRLSQMTDRVEYRQKAEQLLAAFSSVLKGDPQALPQMMAAVTYHLCHPTQIVIAGKPAAADTQALLRAVHEQFIPNKRLVLADGAENQRTLATWNASFGDFKMIGGKATAYVCANYICRRPTTDPADLARLLADELTLAPGTPSSSTCSNDART